MAIDPLRFVEGLAEVARMLEHDPPGLVVVDALTRTVGAASGGVGATFAEFPPDSQGRVVAATGDMAWTLGQPIPSGFIDPEVVRHEWFGEIHHLPVGLLPALHERGISWVAGHPVHVGDRVVAVLSAYFAEVDPPALSTVPSMLQGAAAVARSIYQDRATSPAVTPAQDDDRSLFLAVAGHELRTPVTVLKGYAALLADRWDSLDEASRLDSVRVLRARADELARLVDRVLGATVADPATTGLIRTAPFDPVEALHRFVAELPVETRSSVRVELPPSLPPAVGDPAVLGSILTELVTNALRAGGREPVELTATADAETVVVSVADRGVGIDPAEAEQAFERFWRSQRGPTGRPGVGLGLFLVRRLVERQKGWVSLRPRDGGGTVARVRLRRADGPLRPGGSRL